MFKGGTLIEIGLENKDLRVSDVKDALKKIDLGDINVKNFGDDSDFWLKLKK